MSATGRPGRVAPAGGSSGRLGRAQGAFEVGDRKSTVDPGGAEIGPQETRGPTPAAAHQDRGAKAPIDVLVVRSSTSTVRVRRQVFVMVVPALLGMHADVCYSLPLLRHTGPAGRKRLQPPGTKQEQDSQAARHGQIMSCGIGNVAFDVLRPLPWAA